MNTEHVVKEGGLVCAFRPLSRLVERYPDIAVRLQQMRVVLASFDPKSGHVASASVVVWEKGIEECEAYVKDLECSDDAQILLVPFAPILVARHFAAQGDPGLGENVKLLGWFGGYEGGLDFIGCDGTEIQRQEWDEAYRYLTRVLDSMEKSGCM